MDGDKDTLFREVQRFSAAILLAVEALVLVALGVSFWTTWSAIQPQFGEMPWLRGTVLTNVAVGVVGVVLPVAILLFVRMTTEVRPDGVYVRLFPFHWSPRRISLENVTKVSAVTYRPLLHYGGWGIRGTWHGKAYNMRGNRGARIDYETGRHFLIGSQKPEELASAIYRLMTDRGKR